MEGLAMGGKTVVWGLSVTATDKEVRIVGLPGVSGELVAYNGGYKFVTEDGATHAGKAPSDQQWDLRTSLRYSLLAYRNLLNSAISNAAWPRQRGQAQRTSRVAELARMQEQTNALLLQLMKRFGEQGNKEQGNK
jgi:hypothetical protein